MQELKFEKFAIEEEGLFVSDYKIFDEKRTLVAEAKGQIFSKAKELRFYTKTGLAKESTYQITKEGLFNKEYYVVKDTIVEAVLTRDSSLFTKSFSIETTNHGTLTLRGNMWKNDYVIEYEDIEIAKISRQRTIFSKDTYGTAIRADFDYKLILCIIIILDIIIDVERQSRG